MTAVEGTSESALVAELQRLRQRVRELESQLVTERNIAPGGEIASEVWQAMVDHAGMYVVLLDAGGRIVYLNHADANYQKHELVGQILWEWTHPDYRANVREALRKVFEEGVPTYFEARDGRVARWFGCHYSPVKLHGRVVAASNVCIDITEQRELEQQGKQRETRLQFLLDHLPAFAWTVDTSMHCTSAAGAALTKLGLTPEQAVGLNVYDYFGVGPGEQSKTAHYRALNGESAEIEYNWMGRTYHALIQPIRNAAGEVIGASGVAVDITDRSLREKEVRSARDALEVSVAERTDQLNVANHSLLRERMVLKRLLDLYDRDRQLIAYEIHDGMVQDMTGALMFFEGAAEAVKQKSPAVNESFQHGTQLLRSSIQEARRLINGLRPPVLDEFGLVDAIGNHVEELRARLDMDIHYEHDVKFARLAPVVESALFRIVQEALNNVWHHSEAKRVEISIRQIDDSVTLRIHDDGKGFDVNAIKPKRYGLMSIRERARLLGGQATIESHPGDGTSIAVTLPITDTFLPGTALDDSSPSTWAL